MLKSNHHTVRGYYNKRQPGSHDPGNNTIKKINLVGREELAIVRVKKFKPCDLYNPQGRAVPRNRSGANSGGLAGASPVNFKGIMIATYQEK